MKKILVLALAIVMALSVVALVACGKEETVKGEYSYNALNSTTNKYGCKVTVTVKDGVIKDVKVDADTETFYNLTASWKDKSKWETGNAGMISKLIGMKVEDVKKITVSTQAADDAEHYAPKGQPTGITGAPEGLTVTGATQSSGRLILAVQNALEKLGK